MAAAQTSKTSARELAAKLGPPFIVSAALAAVMFFGGDAYHIVGLQALASTESVLAKALSVAAIFSVAVLAQRVVRYVVLEGLVGAALGGPVPRLLPQLTALVIYVVAGGAVAGFVFNQDLTALWAASGVAGVVFGMALREMILDVFSGLAINVDRPIRIGDRIQVLRPGAQPLTGRVVEINWRSTRICTEDDNLAVVPNSVIAGSTIINMSLPEPVMEYPVLLTLDNAVEPARAMRILNAAAREAAAVYAKPGAPPPYVALRSVTPSGAEYGVFVNPAPELRYRARSLTLIAALRHLALAGIEPARPKLERREEPSAVAGVGADRVAELLGALPLFSGLDADALNRLASTGARARFAAGATVAQAGEIAGAFYVVLEGLVQEHPGGVCRGPGAVLGAAATLSAAGYRHTLTAVTETLVEAFDHAAVKAMLDGREELAAGLADRLAAETVVGDDLDARADYAADVLGAMRRAYAIRG